MVLLFFCYSDIVHLYHSKENDWGYGNFITWQVINFKCIKIIKKPLTNIILPY